MLILNSSAVALLTFETSSVLCRVGAILWDTVLAAPLGSIH